MEQRFDTTGFGVAAWVFVSEHPKNPAYVILVNGTNTKCVEKSKWDSFCKNSDDAYKEIVQKMRSEADFIEREFLKIPKQETLSNEFIQKIVNSILEFRQSQQPIDIDIDDWNENCFEAYYKYSDGRWILSRISEGLTEMINDKDYNVSETELLTV